MTTDTYNGWANHETWAVVLHLDNDQGLQGAARALATRNDYGDGLKEFVDRWVYDLINDGSPTPTTS